MVLSADMLITVDSGRLWRAEKEGIFQPVDSALLSERIPAHLRHPEGEWFGLSTRARVIAHKKDMALPAGFGTYEALADEAFRGKCACGARETFTTYR